ncbi:MAG: helix-turn-helix domain-containing protein [Bacteroidia bacterium]
MNLELNKSIESMNSPLGPGIINPELNLAEQFALRTNQSFFLTGKAGTGKTTLLKKIAEKTFKNYVIVAPTGVAAINAGGVTIHSMFQLPITGFIPSNDFVDVNIITNQKMLAANSRLGKDRRRLLYELELLIIDEVSMVRSDILDAIDFTLRMVRKNQEPFGGVQVMLIGDMHQLPPVIKDHEWEILSRYYKSQFFFDSHAWQKVNAAHIELIKIYRQQDETFVNLLNNIRGKSITASDYEHLEKRYNPGFNPTEPGYVLLSTHNRIADNINETEIRKLPSTMHTFEAIITGEFPENMFPCERVIRLKKGAQVMFIKNDVEAGQYYNGKLATVKKIEGGDITVTFNDSKIDFTLHRELWENINYSVDKGTERVTKNELGTFRQYPLRLAWAITIHKSQGLTFDKVIIDAGQSFAAGQVYVALSRCRSLEGIVLHSRISESVLFSDQKINSFSDSKHGNDSLESLLTEAKTRYSALLVKRLFTFNKLTERLFEWKEMIEQKTIPGKENILRLFETIKKETENIIAVAGKFENQLGKLLNEYQQDENKLQLLKDRCTKAIEYFANDIFIKLIEPLHEHAQSLAYKSKVKKYFQYVQSLEDNLWNKINQLYNAFIGDEKLFSGEIKFRKDLQKKVETSITTTKKEKGGTFKDTLNLYHQGKSINEIATIRGLVSSTIKSHFTKWISTGEINIYKVFAAADVERMEKFIAEHPNGTFSATKTVFNDEFDYNDIRMVINHVNRRKLIDGGK